MKQETKFYLPSTGVLAALTMARTIAEDKKLMRKIDKAMGAAFDAMEAKA